MKIRRVTAVVMVLVVIVSAAAGEQARVYQQGDSWVEEATGMLPMAASLLLKLGLGSIYVQGRDEKNIAYVIRKRVRAASEKEARRRLAHFHFSARKFRGKATIQGSEAGDRQVGAELWVGVPKELKELKALTNGGDVFLDGVGGVATVTTGGGMIDVGSTGSDLVLKTGGGSIKVASAQGTVSAASGGGNIFIGAVQRGVVARTGGGSIAIQYCGGPVGAQTIGGNLDVGHAGGKVSLQTNIGSIRLRSADGPVVASTGAGEIELWGLTHGAIAQTGGGEILAEFVGGNSGNFNSSLQTADGDVIVSFRPGLSVTVRAAILSGAGHRIQSDFQEIRVATPEGLHSIYAEGSVNGGGPSLAVRTAAGNLEFHQAPK